MQNTLALGSSGFEKCADASVYETPESQYSFDSGETRNLEATTQESSLVRNKSSLNLDKYEQMLKEQRGAIKERNDLIQELTQRLRATADEQNGLLRKEQLRIKELEMELTNTKYLTIIDSKLRSEDALSEPREKNAHEETLNLQIQVGTLQKQLEEALDEASTCKSLHAETQGRLEIIENHSRSLECELSEIKTQLIWTSEEHEQTKVHLQTCESELIRVRQDLQLKDEALAEANARLEALRKFETESCVLHRSLQQLKEELSQSQILNRSLREKRESQTTSLSIDDSISESTQYFEMPLGAAQSNCLSQSQRNDIIELLRQWPECGSTRSVDTVDDFIVAIHSICEYLLKGRTAVEVELHDIRKEGPKVKSLQDAVDIVRHLKEKAIQGRRVPDLEEEICSLKAKLAEFETRTGEELDQTRTVECQQSFVEIERIRQETEADMFCALKSETIQSQHEINHVEKSFPNLENNSLHDTPLEYYPSSPCLGKAPKATAVPDRNIENDYCSAQSSLNLILEDSHELRSSLLEEKKSIIRKSRSCVANNDEEPLLKLTGIQECLMDAERQALQAELNEKIQIVRRQTEENVEQKYLAKIASLTAKHECDKNSALHDQLLRYLHDLSEPMTVHDHLIAIGALLEQELLESRLIFSDSVKEKTSVPLGETEDAWKLYDQLCDNIENTRIHFEDLCRTLTRSINTARDAVILPHNELKIQLQAVTDSLQKKTEDFDRVRAELEAARVQMGELLKERDDIYIVRQKIETRLLESKDVLEKMKDNLGIEFDDSERPTILQASKNDIIRYEDLSNALRNGTELAEEEKRTLMMRLNDSQSSFDISRFVDASCASSVVECLAQLHGEHLLFQARSDEIEDQKDFSENVSMLSSLNISGCEVKLSDSLIKLVGELRIIKRKNELLEKELSNSFVAPETENLKRSLQSNSRLLGILSDVVKTCVSCEQDIVRCLEDAIAMSSENMNHTTLPIVEEEEPILSFSSALNAFRDERLSGSYPLIHELNELTEDSMDFSVSLVSMPVGAADPPDDMVLIPSRRLKASVSHIVDYVRRSTIHWTSKVEELKEELDSLKGRLNEEETSRWKLNKHVLQYEGITDDKSLLGEVNLQLNQSCGQEASVTNGNIASLEVSFGKVSEDRGEVERSIQSLVTKRDQQLAAMERRLNETNKFFHQISLEKDAECEALELEVRNLQETLEKERSRRFAASEEGKQSRVDSLESELEQKKVVMNTMADERFKLERELRCAREKIDDLSEVIDRLEHDLKSLKTQLELASPSMPDEFSPTFWEFPSNSSAQACSQELRVSLRLLRGQLCAENSELGRLRIVVRVVCQNLRVMHERMHSVLIPEKFCEDHEEQGPKVESLSTCSSLHISQLEAFEEDFEKLLTLLTTMKHTEERSAARIAFLQREYEDHEAEINDYRLKNAQLLNRLDKRPVEPVESSIFANESQMRVIVAERKSEGLENELQNALTEIERLKETRCYLENRLHTVLDELHALRKKLAVYEDCEYDLDDIKSANPPKRSSSQSPIEDPRTGANILLSSCQQCAWMKELLEKQDGELRHLRIESFEKSVIEKREYEATDSSGSFSSSSESHHRIQLRKSSENSSLRERLEAELFAWRTEKELLEHHKNVYESKCLAQQIEINQLRDAVEELRYRMDSMIPLVEHESHIRALQETLSKEKMNSIGELELTWQARIDQEREKHLCAIQKKDAQLRENDDLLERYGREREFLTEKLQARSKELLELHPTLSFREQRILGLEAHVEELLREIEQVRKESGVLVRETSLKVKETLKRKSKDLAEQYKRLDEQFELTKGKLCRAETLVGMLEAILQRKIDSALLRNLEEAFPGYGSFRWLRTCEYCEQLQVLLSDARTEIDELRIRPSAEDSEELISLLHKLYWAFRRSESRCMQLLVQKTYLQNCTVKSIEFPRGKRSWKTVAFAVMAVYRMKHRRIRWTMAAVAHSDKKAIINKITPYIQNVPTSGSF